MFDFIYFNIIRSDSDQTLLEEWSRQGMFCLPFFCALREHLRTL